MISFAPLKKSYILPLIKLTSKVRNVAEKKFVPIVFQTFPLENFSRTTLIFS